MGSRESYFDLFQMSMIQDSLSLQPFVLYVLCIERPVADMSDRWHADDACARLIRCAAANDAELASAELHQWSKRSSGQFSQLVQLCDMLHGPRTYIVSICRLYIVYSLLGTETANTWRSQCWWVSKWVRTFISSAPTSHKNSAAPSVTCREILCLTSASARSLICCCRPEARSWTCKSWASANSK